jgi:hypothetical protein
MCPVQTVTHVSGRSENKRFTENQLESTQTWRISDTDLSLARGRRTRCVKRRDSRRNGSQIRTTKSRSGPFSGNSVRTPRSIVTSFPFLCIASPNKYASVTC